MSQISTDSRPTYSMLHWLMVILPGALLIVSFGSAFQSRNLPGSISAFYGGPVRDVFVGVLIALAACMIAYPSSNPVERYNLKGAAFYALFVALVPTGLDGILDDLRGRELLSPDGVTASEYVWSLRISLTLVTVLCIVYMAGIVRQLDRGRATRVAVGFVACTLLTLAGFLGYAMYQLWVPRTDVVTLPHIHGVAAIFLIMALAAAVWSHAWPALSANTIGEEIGADSHQLAYQNHYRVIFGLMTLGAVVVGVITHWVAPGHMILILEWWEISLFAAFWISEARRLTPA